MKLICVIATVVAILLAAVASADIAAFTNEALVASLSSRGYLTHECVKDAFNAIDRRHFVPQDYHKQPQYVYTDGPLAIGYGVTMGVPSSQARMLHEIVEHFGGCEAMGIKLAAKDTIRILDVGSGTGIVTAYLANLINNLKMVKDKKVSVRVHGLEHVKGLVLSSTANLKMVSSTWVGGNSDSSEVQIHEGDGRDGLYEESKFDIIHVGAGAHQGIPHRLKAQLARGGVLVIPVDALHINQVIGGARPQRGETHIQHINVVSMKEKDPGDNSPEPSPGTVHDELIETKVLEDFQVRMHPLTDQFHQHSMSGEEFDEDEDEVGEL